MDSWFSSVIGQLVAPLKLCCLSVVPDIKSVPSNSMMRQRLDDGGMLGG